MSLYENLSTPPVFWSQLLGLRAEALALAGRPEEALAQLDRAIALVPEGSWESAARRLQRGGVLAAAGDAEGARASLRRALADASRAGARMTELQAATALARLAQGGGEAGTTTDTETLGTIYETFTEGFETAPLLEARALLDAAAARS